MRRAGPVAPFVFLGAVGFSFAVLDLAFGTGLRIPLLGGTMFDGVRFYGLPNAFIGLVLAGAVFLAVALSPGQGFALLMAAGVVVGYPSLGADIGGAVTLFAAAAVWWALVVRRGSRSRPRDAAIAVGIVVAGTLGVLLANRYLAVTPTHATRFVEGGGLSPADVVRREVDRLAVGFRMIRRIPAGWIPVLGTPVLLGFAIMRPTPFGQGFEAVDRNWREAMIALTTAGAASVLANDTFVAAVGLTFLYALAGMAYPALLAPGGDRRPIRPAVGRRREMERRR